MYLKMNFYPDLKIVLRKSFYLRGGIMLNS